MKLVYFERQNETEPELLTEKEFINFVNDTLIDNSVSGTENDKIEDLMEAIEYAGELGYSIEWFEKDFSSIYEKVIEDKMKEHKEQDHCCDYDIALQHLEADTERGIDKVYDAGRYEAFIEILNEIKDIK